MLQLTIRPPGAGFSSSGLTEVQSWRDLSGEPIAFGYVGRNARWIRWPGSVAFRFDDPKGQTFRSGFGGCVEAFPERQLAEATILDLYRRSVQPLVLQALGWETLHASAVLTPRGVVGFCGERGSGKSTIAYALSRRYNQFADDTLVVQVDGRDVRALRLPYGVRLRAEARAFFGAVKTAIDPVDGSPSEPIRCLFALRRVQSGNPAVERLSPCSAFTTLLAHAHSFDPTSSEPRRRTLERYLEVGSAVPVYELRYAPSLRRLDEILTLVERTTVAA